MQNLGRWNVLGATNLPEGVDRNCEVTRGGQETKKEQCTFRVHPISLDYPRIELPLLR
jgi:hypothetical protein